jgi:glutamyl-tRNA synthetase
LVPDAEAKLCADLRWAGLQWDEGPEIGGPYGPYRQSERAAIYQAHARELLDRREAYRCFCTPQAVGSQRSNAFVTSGCSQNCSSLPHDESKSRAESDGESFTIRLHQPPDVHKRTYPDLVYGKIKRLKRSPASTQALFGSEDSGESITDAADTILVKSDGTPTYHFANVVDDHLMKVTHVIRGAEWMASTPLHYDIYSAFEWEPPQFAHVGLLVDENQAKLSKRNSDLALDVASMREKQTVLPSALTNYLALLGWSTPTQNEIMDMEMLIENFDLKFTRGNAQVQMLKLGYLQSQHAFARLGLAQANGDLTPLLHILNLITKEVRKQFAEPFYNGSVTYAQYHDVLPDRLAAYCADILSLYRNELKDVATFVQKYCAFFCQQYIDTPHENGIYEGHTSHHYGVRVQVLDTLARSLVEDLDWSSTIPPPDCANSNAFAVRRLGLLFTKIITQRVWSVVLDNTPITVLRNAPPPPDAETYPIQPEAVRAALQDIPAIMEGNAAPFYTLALRLLSHTKGGQLTKYDPEQVRNLATVLEWRRKTLSNVIFSYLRLKLTNHINGPAVGSIMAVLGEDECRARLTAPTKIT